MNIKSKIVILILLLKVTLLFSNDYSTMEMNRILGLKLYTSENYAEALKEFEKNLIFSPEEMQNADNALSTYIDSVYYSALCWFYLNQIDKSINTISLLYKYTQNEKKYLDIATLFFDKGYKNEAIKILNDYLKINGDSSLIYYDLGWYYFEIKNYDKTVECGLKSYNYSKSSCGPLLNAGLAYLMKGEFENSINTYFQTIEIVNTYPRKRNIRELKTAIYDIKKYYLKQSGNNNSGYFVIWALNKYLNNDKGKNECLSHLKNDEAIINLLDSLEKKGELNDIGEYYLSCFYSVVNNITLSLKYLEKGVNSSSIIAFNKIESDADLLNIKLIPDYKKIINDFQKIELSLQSGHTDTIEDIGISPDGMFIASVSEDNTVKLWNKNGILLRTLYGHTNRVNRVIFSPDSKMIATGSKDSYLIIWNLDGSIVSKMIHGSRVEAIAFSHNGDLIATCDMNDIITIWTVDGKLVRTFPGKYPKQNSIDFSPDDKYLISCSGDTYINLNSEYTSNPHDNLIRLWNIKGNLIRTFDGHSDYVNEVKFLPDGETFISCSDDQTIKIWNVSGKVIRTINANTPIETISVNGDGDKIISSGSFVQIWDLNGKLLKKVETENQVARISRDSDFFAFASGNNLSVIDYNSNKSFNFSSSIISGFRNSKISPDNKKLFWISDDNSVRYYDFNKSEVYKIDLPINDNTEMGEEISFSNDCSYIMKRSETYIHVYSIDGKLVNKFSKFTDNILCMKISNDNKYLITGESSGRVTVWDFNGNKISSLKKNIKEIATITISNDNKYIVTGTSTGVIDLWTKNGKYVRNIGKHNETGIEELLISSNNEIIVSSSGCLFFSFQDDEPSVRIWSIQGKLLNKLELNSNIVKLSFNKEENKLLLATQRILATTKSKDMILECDLNLNILNKYIDQFDDITNCFYAFNDNFLISSSMDGTIKIRNLKNRQVLTFFNLSSNRWFIFNNKGYFNSSNNIKNSILFVKGFETYQPDQFWENFYTPNLFELFINNQQIGSEDINIVYKYAPKIEVIDLHIGPLTTNKLKKKFSFRIKEGENGSGKIILYQNGRILDEKSKTLKIVKNDNIVNIEIELIEGTNKIICAAYDKSNTVEGRSKPLFINYTPIRLSVPDMYIFSFGVSQYKDTNLTLISPDKDAEVLADTIERVAGNIYKKVNKYVLTSKNSSKTKILDLMKNISKNIQNIDTVIMYFSGHGIMEEGIYYFLPYDTDITDIKKSGISIDDIGKIIGLIPANKLVVFFDTCQSGGAVKSLTKIALSRSIEEKKIIASLAKNRGIAVFSASSASQLAYEIKELDHGIFTYCFIDTINNNSNEIVDNENLVIVSKLFGVVNKYTRNIALKYLGIEQSPIMYIFGDDFPIGYIK